MLCVNFWMSRTFSLATFLEVPHVCLIKATVGRYVRKIQIQPLYVILIVFVVCFFV